MTKLILPYINFRLIPFTVFSLLSILPGCPGNSSKNNREKEADLTFEQAEVTVWHWEGITIPPYSWPAGTAFGPGLFVDVAYDEQGVTIDNNLLKFSINPIFPTPPATAPSAFNYRSEIHTDPWPIEHPLGTEQWIGWKYIFGSNYKIDRTSPITIFQNHPGVNGLSPQFELEIAGKNDPPPANGGEIQVVNAANNERIVYPVVPKTGKALDIVIHVIYGVDSTGLLQVWLNDVLYYNKIGSTVYEDHPWGGNNKWGIYHHTFNNNDKEVEHSLSTGGGIFDLFMGPLKMLTRTPDDPNYGQDAYYSVSPK